MWFFGHSAASVWRDFMPPEETTLLQARLVTALLTIVQFVYRPL